VPELYADRLSRRTQDRSCEPGEGAHTERGPSVYYLAFAFSEGLEQAIARSSSYRLGERASDPAGRPAAKRPNAAAEVGAMM